MSVWPRPYEGWPRKRRRNDVQHGLVDTAGPDQPRGRMWLRWKAYLFTEGIIGNSPI